MTIPYPIVKDSTGKEYTDKASFSLGNKHTTQTKQANKNLPPDAPKSLTTQNSYDLTIAAKDLQNLSYPISVDPTVQVPGAGNFNNANDEGGITNSGTQITRASLTGGTIGNFTQDVNSLLPDDTFRGAVATYSGYVYIAGGNQTGVQLSSNVRWTSINNMTGDVGSSWSNSTMTSVHGVRAAAVVYNGYLYVLGGSINLGSQTYSSTVDYAKLAADGTPGTWHTATTLPSARMGLSGVAANGYIYITGGCDNVIGAGTIACVNSLHTFDD
jgi:hypothetical protein